ncbi:MAG: hypothetical protein JKX84_06980 [Flavobacteriales bacterium]|nr:hypothetical protein [Flavobacteriales bacterium]
MKMRQLLTLFFLTISVVSFGQICDTINGEILNCVDANGLKQGYWEMTWKRVTMSWHGGYGTAEGCQYGEIATYLPLENGNYRDNKKIGKWTYYDDEKYWGSPYIENEITYDENGSIKVDQLKQQRYLLNINMDTSFVRGYFLHQLDSIAIMCHFDTCHFTLSNHNELTKFSFDSIAVLEDQLYRLQIGLYDREIKIKKKK